MMANKGREYAENLVGALDRSAYNQQRDVAQNIYNTNWQNVQNQYKNLQDKLKLQQEKANRDYAEGLINVAEDSFNRQRVGSGNLANRGLAASGLTNILSQADTEQKGEDIGKLLKSVGAISADTADKLSQATSKYAQEGSSLMGKLSDTLGNIGDSETAAQNAYNQTLASIAGSMDQREANNALQAAQRAASRASSGTSSEQKQIANELEELYKRAGISKVLADSDMTDNEKANYLGIIYGVDNANGVVNAYNNNINAVENYNTKLDELEKAANAEIRKNKQDVFDYYTNEQRKKLENSLNRNASRFGGSPMNSTIAYNPNLAYPVASYTSQNALTDLKNKGITYEDLAQLLYGNK